MSLPVGRAEYVGTFTPVVSNSVHMPKSYLVTYSIWSNMKLFRSSSIGQQCGAVTHDCLDVRSKKIVTQNYKPLVKRDCKWSFIESYSHQDYGRRVDSMMYYYGHKQ